MRYRTAAIFSVVLIVVTGGMFAIESVLKTTFIPPLHSNLPLSGFDRNLISVALFCGFYKWLLALFTFAAVPVLVTIAVFTSDSRVGDAAMPAPPPAGPPPALWNPKAAAYWSLIFSPAFGAFVHARNADAMGRIDEAKANRRWFYVLLAYLAFTFMTIFVPAFPEGLLDLVLIGLLFGWYLSLGKKQVMYVKATWREGYERKSWKKPLLVASGCLIVTIIASAEVGRLVLGQQ
ncbi:MAG: hypothetical protein WAK13_00160 [Terriglobales bacterium]